MQEGEKLEAVIFDMDGLMFETERVFALAWDYAGEKAGIGKAGYMITKTLGMSISAARPLFIEEFGDSYDEALLKSCCKEFIKDYYVSNSVPVKKGLHSLLQYLSPIKYKTAVASSSPMWEVEKHLKNAGIYDGFQAIVSGDDVTNTKPDPEIYTAACITLGVKPCSCIALEDSKNGIYSAYNAGCRPIMVPDLWQPDSAVLQILWNKFSDLSEIENYLRKHPDILS